MTIEAIRMRVASPEVLKRVVRALRRSTRLREQAPAWLRKLAERDGSNGGSMVSNNAEGKNKKRSLIHRVT